MLYCVRTKWSSHVDDKEPFAAPFDTEFEILLNVAVGGNWPGYDIDNNSLPARMTVDYVRYSNDRNMTLQCCRAGKDLVM